MNQSTQKTMFSSENHCWETPQNFFDQWNELYDFKTDVCATAENAKCERYYTPEQDGLKQEWTGTCWMNPPYGYGIGKWIKKAYESALRGATVVCLLPARTDTAWWHEYCIRGKVHFVRGRIKFVGAKSAAPFPSVVVVFDF